MIYVMTLYIYSITIKCSRWVLLGSIFFVSFSLYAQGNVKNSFSVQIGSGYPSVNGLDEIITRRVNASVLDRGDREACIPLNIGIDFGLTERIKVGGYIGYELEKKSGTIAGFGKRNHHLVYGVRILYYFYKKHTHFHLYSGIMLFRARGGVVIEDPSFIGVSLQIMGFDYYITEDKNWSIFGRLAVNVALLEFGISKSFRRL